MDAEAFVTRISACANRDEAALVYLEAMIEFGDVWGGAWPAINRAITERWSRAGLLYVKKKAWKLRKTPLELRAVERAQGGAWK